MFICNYSSSSTAQILKGKKMDAGVENIEILMSLMLSLALSKGYLCLYKIFTFCVSFLFLYIWLYCVFRWLTKIAMLKRRNRHLVVFPRNVCPDLNTVYYYLPTLWARCIQGWVWKKLVNEVTTVPRNPSPIVWKSTEIWVHTVSAF